MEGFLFGIPAIAFSQVERDWHHLDAATIKVRELVQSMQQQQIIGHTPFLLNVNIPNKPYKEIGSMKLCRLGRRHAAEKVIQQTSPRGETMYWIGAAGPVKDDADGTDFHATAQGHMAMTPLKVDLTDHDHLSYWAQTASRLVGKVDPATP
jgi:5'-nucleotidase